MNIDTALKEFMNYTNNYKEYGRMIELKINHTQRVINLSEEIAKSLNLNEKDTNIAKMIGLLHDIGRFEQWKNYNTFKDLDSIDHAELGIDILNKDNYIRKYIKDDKYDELIINSIRNHNKAYIPNNISEREELFSKIIRDADKLDILYLYIDKEIDLEVDDKFTDNAYNLLLKGETINRKDIHTKTDKLSVCLGFVFDINFKYSYKFLKDNNYYDKIINIYKKKTKNKELIKQLNEINKVINNYIEEMLKC